MGEGHLIGDNQRLIIALILCVLAGLFAASETAFLSAGKVGLLRANGRGSNRAQRAVVLLNRPARLIATIIAGITVCSYLAESLLTSVAYRWSVQLGVPWLGVALSFVAAFLLLTFVDVVPALYGRIKGASYALLITPLITIAGKLFRPFIWVADKVTAVLFGIVGLGQVKGPPLVTEGEVLDALQQAAEQGVITKEEAAMVATALEFKDIRVAEVMVPRVDMVAVRADIPLEEAVEVIRTTGHSRVPVYRDTRDEIVGILYAKDALAALYRGERDRTAGELARPPLYATEPQRAYHLLRTMQRQRRGIAIVLDEEGGTAGLVTVEDLLEEIVGEIYDEYDEAAHPFQQVGEGEYLVRASASIRSVEKALGIELPEEDYDSLAELIVDRLETLPSPGDRVEVDGISLEVAEMRGRRITRVRILLPKGEDSGG
ncbi:MAG: hemolysin family protein [Armatimonadetes bacterium]|nr:hemolysin family protein [Armatimonadota bacterium]MDW8120824.1 hemolysin family protein [Armatimonadota bacterium]